MEAYSNPRKRKERVLGTPEEHRESKRRRIAFIKDKVSKRLQLTEGERKDFEAYKRGRRKSRRESETVEYQDEAPMPSMRGDKTPFDKITRRGRKQPRRYGVTITIEPTAIKWVGAVVKHNIRLNQKYNRRRSDEEYLPSSVSAVINKLILEHKEEMFAKIRAEKRST